MHGRLGYRRIEFLKHFLNARQGAPSYSQALRCTKDRCPIESEVGCQRETRKASEGLESSDQLGSKSLEKTFSNFSGKQETNARSETNTEIYLKNKTRTKEPPLSFNYQVSSNGDRKARLD